MLNLTNRQITLSRIVLMISCLGISNASISQSENHHDSDWPQPVMDTESFASVIFDRLETTVGETDETYVWDIQAWSGGDYHKLWIKSEGSGVFGEPVEEAETQLLYSRLLAPFWDIQFGGRYDIRPRPDRGHVVLGIQGLAPCWFEVDAAMFLSDKGDMTFRSKVDYDLLLTQKLILQPSLEVNAAGQDIPELQLASGINSTELGLRLRYEIKREIAPYIGISWLKSYGDTARLLRIIGESSSEFTLFMGLHIWY